jgi:hypothetical protein
LLQPRGKRGAFRSGSTKALCRHTKPAACQDRVQVRLLELAEVRLVRIRKCVEPPARGPDLCASTSDSIEKLPSSELESLFFPPPEGRRGPRFF